VFVIEKSNITTLSTVLLLDERVEKARLSNTITLDIQDNMVVPYEISYFN